MESVRAARAVARPAAPTGRRRRLRPRPHRCRSLQRPIAAAPAAATPPSAAARRRAAAPVDVPPPSAASRFFCWMVGVPPSPARRGAARRSSSAQLLERLDEVIASDTLRAGLLPRAPHVVPQLMKTLRDEGYSSADVASRISKRRRPHRRGGPQRDQRVTSAATTRRRSTSPARSTMIGTQGLRRAIANVVLRPIFDASGDTLSARGRDPDLEGRRPQGAPVRRARRPAVARPVRRLPRRPAAQLGLDRAAARDRRLRGPRSIGSADLAHPDGRAAAAAPARRAVRRARRPVEPEPGDRRPRRRGRPRRPRRASQLAARPRPARGRPARRPARAGARGQRPAGGRARLGDARRSRCRTATPASAPESRPDRRHGRTYHRGSPRERRPHRAGTPEDRHP